MGAATRDQRLHLPLDVRPLVAAPYEIEPALGERRLKTFVAGQAHARGRERVGIVGQEELTLVRDFETFGAERGADDGRAVGEGLEDLDPGAAAEGELDGGYRGPAQIGLVGVEG